MRAQNSTKTVDNASQSVKLLVFRFVGKGGAAVRLSMNTRYAVIHASFWGAYGSLWAFIALVLEYNGFASAQVGVVTSCATLLSVFLSPAVSSVSRRAARPRKPPRRDGAALACRGAVPGSHGSCRCRARSCWARASRSSARSSPPPRRFKTPWRWTRTAAASRWSTASAAASARSPTPPRCCSSALCSSATRRRCSCRSLPR